METAQPLFRSFDVEVVEIFLRFRTPSLDAVTHFLLASDLRIGFLAVLLFYAWVKPEGLPLKNGEYVLRSLVAIFLALVACFFARHLLPQQPRPRLSLAHLEFPPLNGLGHLADFRSFPSDTATLAAAVVMVIFFASRRLGILATFWAVVAVGMPRIYIGYHYLSDILVGYLIGILVPWVVMKIPFGFRYFADVFQVQARQRPALVILLLALGAHQIGTMFPVLQFIGGTVRRYLEQY